MTLRIGLLGASRIAPKALIAPARGHDDVVVTAVAARDPARARTYADRHEIAGVARDYAELVAREDVDLVYCALAPAGHIDPCLQALRAGKALLIEKPFAMNADQAQSIANAADEAGRPAIEAFHYRFHTMFQRALDLVRGGRLGPLVRASGVFDAQIGRGPGELRYDPAQGGGGTMDLGCYVLHALRTLVGEEPRVHGARAVLDGGVDVEMQAGLVFPGGVRADFRCSMTAPRLDWIVLEGERGTLRLNGFVSPQNGGELVLSVDGTDLRERAQGPGSYDAQLDHVVAVMKGQAEPLTGGADAVANMRVIDAMRQAVGMTTAA